MKRIWDILKDTFALRAVWSIFNNDAHNIVSKGVRKYLITETFETKEK